MTVGDPGTSEGKQNRSAKMHARIERELQVGSLYACANQGPVSVTFRVGTLIFKLNAKEYYYSETCIKRTPSGNAVVSA